MSTGFIILCIGLAFITGLVIGASVMFIFIAYIEAQSKERRTP